MVWRRLQAERARGRAYQPRFAHQDVLASWLGGLLAMTSLGLISGWSHDPLVVAPFGASTVLLFGHPRSPLAQPRNIVLGLAVGLTIALGQALRCLHPPAGAVALLGVLLKARPGFVLMPVLSGSLRRSADPYPRHWL